MFRVNGMQIMMTAGDTGLLAVIPDEEGYVPTAEDRAVFTVREKPGRRAVMEKTIVPEADGRVKIEFASADTAQLRPGNSVRPVSGGGRQGKGDGLPRGDYAVRAGENGHCGSDWRGVRWTKGKCGCALGCSARRWTCGLNARRRRST